MNNLYAKQLRNELYFVIKKMYSDKESTW